MRFIAILPTCMPSDAKVSIARWRALTAAIPASAASIAIIPREMPRNISGSCGFQCMARIVRYCMQAVDARPWAHGGNAVALPTVRIRLYSPPMAVSEDYLQYVLEQLSGLGRVTPRRMV